MKVPCRLLLFANEKYVSVLKEKLSMLSFTENLKACCTDNLIITKTKYFFHFLTWKPSIFSSLANSRDFSLSRDPLTSTFPLRKISNNFFNALLNASYFSAFTLLAPRPFSYDWKKFLFFSKWRGCSWSHQKVKQHPCEECSSRAL